MQEPAFSSGPWLSPCAPRKRTRRKRTVFSAEQLWVLEKFFEEKHHGTYEERETLAARLNLQEYQVKVWLKNRRAKDRRLQRLRGQQSPGAQAASQEQEACTPQTVPAPLPASAGPEIQGNPVLPARLVRPATPVFPEESVFPAGPVLSTTAMLPAGPVLPAATLNHEGPGLCNPPPHSPWKVLPAADPSASRYRQASWDPSEGDQGTYSAALTPAPDPDPYQAPAPAPVPDADPDQAPAPGPDRDTDRAHAPAPAPDTAPAPDPHPSKATVSPQGPDAGNFSPDTYFTEMLSLYCPLEESFSSPRPWYDFVGDSEVDLFQLLDLEGSPSPPSPKDATEPEGSRVCTHACLRIDCQCLLPNSCCCAESSHI